MFKKRGQGQSWSLDIILAFVIFVLIIGIFYALLSNDRGNKTQNIALESKTVVSALDSANQNQLSTPNLTLIEKGNIDQERLQRLYLSDYDALKKELGVKGDFCIYIVRQDGTLVTITDPNTGIAIGGFGNGNFSVNDAPCGYNLTN